MLRVEIRTCLRDLSKEATSITINDDRVHVNARVYIAGKCRLAGLSRASISYRHCLP